MTTVLHINSNYLTSLLHENLMEYLEQGDQKNYIYMPIKEEKKEEIKFQSEYNVYSPITFKDYDKYFFTWKQLKIFNQLKDNYDFEDTELVHAHTLFTDGNVAYQIYKEFNIPYVVTVRSSTDIDSFFKIRINLRNRGRKILKGASKIVFLSETSRNDLLNRYISDQKLKNEIIEKSRIVPNGIDDFWFENEGKPKILTNKSSVRLITVGEIIKRKNQSKTIEAAKVLKHNYKLDVKLSVVGKIVDEEYDKQLKSEKGIDIQFIEFIPKEELIELYRENDIFLLPSKLETFGLVYPEAMSQGLPVIYTKGQGFDNQFQDGEVGYSVNDEDAYDIAEKISIILENYEMVSLNAVNRYNKFNWNELSQELIKVYKSALE